MRSFAKATIAAALADYTEEARLDPTLVDAPQRRGVDLGDLPRGQVRSGEPAVEHAKKACELTEWKEGGYIDTLAAAYAEAGDFLSAIRYEEKAINMALSDTERQSGQRQPPDTFSGPQAVSGQAAEVSGVRHAEPP